MPCDATGLVGEVVDEILLSHDGRSIEIDAPAELRVVWDRGRVGQIVSNLVANALQHSAPDSVIRLRIRARDGWVALAVSNTGAEIPAATLQTIFKPFHRGASATPTGSGLGLGLYIAHPIAAAHGGALDVSSADGLATFTLRLPAGAAA